MQWQDSHKRFRLHDDLGYFRSYTSKRRAEQAIESLDSKKRHTWYIIDSLDESIITIIPNSN